MAGKDKMEAYFRHVVVDYNCGDLRKLIALELEQAGPLLACTVNSIDTAGGMMLGFNVASSLRSVAFMEKYLGLSHDAANLMYTVVRCGVAHEGVTKLTMRFFVYYHRLARGTILYPDEPNTIWLNVTELAWSYLDAIAEIERDVHAHLKHIPPDKPQDQALFSRVLAGLDFIDDLVWNKIHKVGISGSGRDEKYRVLKHFTVGEED